MRRSAMFDPLVNTPLLDEINGAGNWFRAKRKRPVWAKRIDCATDVETMEGVIAANTGDYLCRGELGEFWPQPSENLLCNYDATKTVDGDGFRLFLPARSQPGVLAVQMKRKFTIQTKEGILNGKVGDYVLKSFADRDIEYPLDLRIVDSKVFRKTYQRL